MRTLIVLALLLSVTAILAAPSAASTKSEWKNNRLLYYESANRETVIPVSQVSFYDDFIGACFQKCVTGENTTAIWKTIETNLNTGIAVSADAHSIALIMDSDDNAERAVAYFGDQECLDGYVGITFECRAQVSVLPTTNTEIIIGLAGADNSTADSIDVNAWFRLLYSDSDALLWESDDNSTNDDDNAASALAVSTWYVLRIEMNATEARFYVNGVRVGTGVMTALTTTTGMVQPYIAVQKSGGVGVGTLLVDYVRCWGSRQ